jgi:hypothetical protein
VKRAKGDRGGIVLGWLGKLTLTLGVLALVGFDALSLVQARLQAGDRAATAATAAAQDFATSRDLQHAFDAAYATVAGGDSIETGTFRVAADGAVTLRLHHGAVTLLVAKVPALRSWTDAVGTGEGRPSP